MNSNSRSDTTSAEADRRDVPFAAESSAPLIPATITLAEREIVRFFRQRSRLIGALVQPILFWVLFGAGLNGSFRQEGANSFQEYFFPGVAVMILLFTAIFATISIIEDRREGFLQGVLATPTPRLAIVLGKTLGGTTIAMMQVLVFLLIGPLLGTAQLIPPVSTGLTLWNALPVILFLTVLAVALTGLGYVIAWQMESVQGFHAIMSVFLMPMWLLSGAFFPADGSSWLSHVMWLNPLTYGVAGLRRLMSPPGVTWTYLPDLTICCGVTALFCLVCLTSSVVVTHRRSVLNAR